MTMIAVLGNGRVGGSLARALTGAGHAVTVADRSPGSATGAARTAQIVSNATPGAGSLQRLTALREELRGKILVHVSNATADGPDGLPAGLLHPGSSLAEHLQEALPGTRVVKTLNTMLYTVMTAPAALTQPPTAFLSGEDPAAKQAVADSSPTSAGSRSGSQTSEAALPEDDRRTAEAMEVGGRARSKAAARPPLWAPSRHVGA
ncbi:oxidoreductase [Streptomyces chrestomyceticus JCM 4735]|uniref:Oxidoreductase n=1 Tax=Streptomyces chrestomyceticus JCM 4735 TaxID=1306181 RepID=A0A7U9PV28_9ACTN|nr:oxidoreductase [Streptomyces chrestomyceticus JCM 4735]